MTLSHTVAKLGINHPDILHDIQEEFRPQELFIILKNISLLGYGTMLSGGS
jgi:hypothetical protein